MNGRYVEASAGHRSSVLNPATGEEVATFASAGAADVDLAVSGAQEAFESGSWSQRSPRERCGVGRAKSAERGTGRVWARAVFKKGRYGRNAG